MELLFCTNNKHKVDEVKAILGDQFHFLTLRDIGYDKEIPEPYLTLEENSFTKANQVYQETQRNCFGEDTGLFIEALQGEPGVWSARYAGEHASVEQNWQLVLSRMTGLENRKAYFKTVITFIYEGKTHLFTGICAGRIATEPSGKQGFGYDPIFIPDGYDESFADLAASVKNEISHRRKAFDGFSDFLHQLASSCA
jgi:XTP/dITP diphosphohydrolase